MTNGGPGITYSKAGWDSAWETDVEDFKRVMDVDLYGVFYGLKVSCFCSCLCH